jgi:hypothetical protein
VELLHWIPANSAVLNLVAVGFMHCRLQAMTHKFYNTALSPANFLLFAAGCSALCAAAGGGWLRVHRNKAIGGGLLHLLFPLQPVIEQQSL